jgi:hypothetical protein
MVLTDIDHEKFSQDFIRQIKSNDNYNEDLFSSLKYNMIVSKLCRQVNNIEIEENKLIEIKDSILSMLNREQELQRYKNNDISTMTKFNINDDQTVEAINSVINSIYERFLKIKYFDERLFLMEKRQVDCSPIKFTPFRRQRLFPTGNNIGNSTQQYNQPKPTSFKALNFGVPKNISNTNNVKFNLIF